MAFFLFAVLVRHSEKTMSDKTHLPSDSYMIMLRMVQVLRKTLDNKFGQRSPPPTTFLPDRYMSRGGICDRPDELSDTLLVSNTS
jgi:hypothetical protein